MAVRLAAIALIIAAAGSAQTISVVSGNGQIVCPACFGTAAIEFAPLVVEVKNGNLPVPNAIVYWKVDYASANWEPWLGAQPSLALERTVTDANGRTSNTFLPGSPSSDLQGLPYVQSHISATTFYSSAYFTETFAIAGARGMSLLSVTPMYPVAGDTIAGAVGQQGTPFQVMVSASMPDGPLGLSNAEVKLVSDPGLPASVACASSYYDPPGTTRTDFTGLASCTPVFGNKIGAGRFTIRVGGTFKVLGPYDFQVSAGAPASIRIVSGDNQTGAPNTTLASALAAEVDDAGGNPLPGVAVYWDVSQGSATLTATRTITDDFGRVSTAVVLGAAGQPVEVRIRVMNRWWVDAAFRATVNVATAQLQKMSGDAQDAAPASTFPQPLVVQVNNQGAPVAGVPVTFEVSSGSATIDGARSASATTDAQGRASVRVIAGSNVGPVVITAGAYSFRQTFGLTVRLMNLAFLNGASSQPDSVSPCGITVIQGAGIAPGMRGTTAAPPFGPLPYQVANVSVRFDRFAAPIYNVSNSGGRESVTVQVPCELSPGVVPLTISVSGIPSKMDVAVRAASPGIFEAATSDGRSRAVAAKADGTFVSIENPAASGDVLRLYATGLGAITPPAGSVVVRVNDAAMRVIAARYSRELLGVWEVTFEISAAAGSGNDMPIVVGVGEEPVFSKGSAVPIRP